ncbi:esterase-like activity of phytase family protein [Polaribacter sp. WD7]|uniref:esterase-like activity of phytase family protein n=1 Tax=Polaribacter sp. WD7 TaxID=2269061 RepID=UPI000DF1130C|nr:esterase-like activity of phytase family protein [Polaribacter sp. WD7]RCS27367.1 esterase-like activity of phytase family protein [Polaribacter sp. WD7]
MKKIVFLLIVFCCFLNVVSGQVKLNYLDEFIIQDSLTFKNTIVGGLSGIDYAHNTFYFVVDDAQNPRIISAKIKINDGEIQNVHFTDVVLLEKSKHTFFNNNTLDLESIFVDEKENIYLVSEGSIKKKKLPSVFKVDKKGIFLERFHLPKHLSNLKNIKHNAAFEASSRAIHKDGFWIAMEGVLKSDGKEASFQKTNSPIRITYIHKSTKKAIHQYAYQLEAIPKPPKGNINLNGVTAILEYKKNSFLVVERIYQNGYGAYGNTIKIFEATVDENTTNTLQIEALVDNVFYPLKKRLLLDFDDIRNQLTEGIVDNIEGITFGPKLSNGNQSLLLVSDDNFQIYGKQLNQLILLEIVDK